MKQEDPMTAISQYKLYENKINESKECKYYSKPIKRSTKLLW